MFGAPCSDWHFDSLLRVYRLNDISGQKKYALLYEILERVTKQAVKREALSFSNLFSRLAFLETKYTIKTSAHDFRSFYQAIHTFSEQDIEKYFGAHWVDMNLFVSELFNVPVPDVNRENFPSILYRRKALSSFFTNYIEELQVVFIKREGDILLCREGMSSTGELIKVVVGVESYNDAFTSVAELWSGASLSLINVNVDGEMMLYPRLIVLEPDYLFDISAIAASFQEFSKSPLLFVINKFTAVPNSKYILLGNFANQVVDDCIANIERLTELRFEEVFKKHFEQFPFEHLYCEDIETRSGFLEYQEDCRSHFVRIKNVVAKDFFTYGILSKDRIILEPSFISPIYGVQGRLDLLYLPESNKQAITVVELKSGGTVYPDDGIGVKESHSAQLFLYYLMLTQSYSVSLKSLHIENKIRGFIFYSKVAKGNLRSDHISIGKVQEILELRNQIMLLERKFQLGSLNDISAVFRKITLENIVGDRVLNHNFARLLQNQYSVFLKPISEAAPLLQAYFYSFVNFIAREQQLSKYGDTTNGSGNSQAALWRKSVENKLEDFSLLYDLEVVENNINTEAKRILFKRSESNSTASFRVGEACILYPLVDDKENIKVNQVFKCTIKEVTSDIVEVVFRYQQSNLLFFTQHSRWAIERDVMDSSFTGMYRGLYSFMKGEKWKQDLILLQEKPRKNKEYGFFKPNLSGEQNRILNNALSAKDYFILNGPPGTGKTSHIVKELIAELYNNSTVNILVLSYTNRAVDEMCQAMLLAVGSNGNSQPFIRIGHKISSDEAFHPYLLDNCIKVIKHKNKELGKTFGRIDLNTLINNQRIFTGTVSTLSSKLDLLRAKKFDVVIIDEASQILEPQILGILMLCKKFIMIGDHKQLPAIVLQSQESSQTNNNLLESIGLLNRRNSLFERLFLFCKKNKIAHAFDTLTYQGRMHSELAVFPNQYFYEGKLQEAFYLDNLSIEAKEYLIRQVQPLALEIKDATDELSCLLAKQRLLFFDKRATLEESFTKTSKAEAKFIVKIILALKELYLFNQKSLILADTIGIIAPFKNQIALLRTYLERYFGVEAKEIIIDTVERFQGGQRDIIIYSMTVNNIHHLNSLVNLNDDKTVDRKLNVALTRAKEQLIIIGNKTVLSNSPLYAALIDHIEEAKVY